MTPLSTLTNEALHSLVAKTLEGVTEGPELIGYLPDLESALRTIFLDRSTYDDGLHEARIPTTLEEYGALVRSIDQGLPLIDRLRTTLEEWVKPCFCRGNAKCLMCETKELLSVTGGRSSSNESRDLVPELDRRLRETEAKLEVAQSALSKIHDHLARLEEEGVYQRHKTNWDGQVNAARRTCRKALTRIAALTQP